jgi:hypothetical protein
MALKRCAVRVADHEAAQKTNLRNELGDAVLATRGLTGSRSRRHLPGAKPPPRTGHEFVWRKSAAYSGSPCDARRSSARRSVSDRQVRGIARDLGNFCVADLGLYAPALLVELGLCFLWMPQHAPA